MKTVVVLAILIVLLTVMIQLGLWNSHGSLLDVIAGQFEPEPQQLVRDIAFIVLPVR